MAKLPEDFMVEAVCSLLETIGRTLDDTAHGKVLMSQFSARLINLKGKLDAECARVYSLDIIDGIDGLLDLRQSGWAHHSNARRLVVQCSVSSDSMGFLVACTALNGKELCIFMCDVEETIVSLVRNAAQKLNTRSNWLRLLLPDGRILNTLRRSMLISDLLRAMS